MKRDFKELLEIMQTFPTEELYQAMIDGQIAIKLIRKLVREKNAKKFEQIKYKMRQFIQDYDRLDK